MKSQDPRDWQRRLQELEAELNQTPSAPFSTQPGQPLQPSSGEPDQPSQALFSRLSGWFQGLSDSGKIVAAVAGVILGLAVIRVAVQLISLFLSLAFLGVLLYVVYRLFLAPKASK